MGRVARCFWIRRHRREIPAFYPDALLVDRVAQRAHATSKPSTGDSPFVITSASSNGQHRACTPSVVGSTARCRMRTWHVDRDSEGQGYDVLGLDLSTQAADIAARENGVRVVVGTLDEAGFPDASFGIVTLFHVLEHVIDPRAVLREVGRVLRPHGRVVLQVPNIDSWQSRLLGARWWGLHVPRHIVDYSALSIQILLESNRVRREEGPAFQSAGQCAGARVEPLPGTRSPGSRDAAASNRGPGVRRWVMDQARPVSGAGGCGAPLRSHRSRRRGGRHRDGRGGKA